MKELAEIYGPNVLRLPGKWQRMLYLEEANVESSWPFMEARLGTQAVVSQFEVSELDKIQPLVVVIPVQFVTSSMAEVVLELVRKVREEQGEATAC